MCNCTAQRWGDSRKKYISEKEREGWRALYVCGGKKNERCKGGKCLFRASGSWVVMPLPKRRFERTRGENHVALSIPINDGRCEVAVWITVVFRLLGSTVSFKFELQHEMIILSNIKYIAVVYVYVCTLV